MRLGLLVAFTLSLLLPVAVLAQSIPNIGGQAFTISVSPKYPEPQGQAAISMLSSSLDLANAICAVSVANKEIYRGSVKPITVPLGRAGSVTSVKVTVSSAGASYSQTISIQPQDVTLVAEPISSAPALYPGKPLVPIEGDVRMVAMANLRDSKGKAINPASYSYAWTVDGTRIINSSGIGKDTIIVASPLQYRSRSVSVAVASPDGSLVGGAEFSFTPADPLVRIYENDPLLGIRYERLLSGNYAISDAENTLFAAPFSFPTTSGAPLIEWFLNGESAQTGSLITLRPTGKGQGVASLSLVASAGQSVRATEDLSLSFGNVASSILGIFGL